MLVGFHLCHPALECRVCIIHEKFENRKSLGKLEPFAEFILEPSVEISPVIVLFVGSKSSGTCPDQRVGKHHFQQYNSMLLPNQLDFLEEFLATSNKSLHQIGDALYHRDLSNRHDGFGLPFQVSEDLLSVFSKKRCKACPLHFHFAIANPTFYVRFPSNVVAIQKYYTASRNRGRGGLTHVLDFKQQSHGRRERNALVTGQGQRLIVIHDGIHGLNPLGINVAIENQILVFHCEAIGQVTENLRKQAIFPLSSGRMYVAVKLVAGD